jgi:cation diffusion facilitator CzcD-associated flavoprotein CzcO
VKQPRIVIVGAGFGGVAVANELKRRGHDDLVILEQAGDVGGVWRDNTYPGAACDVPTPYYSLSYEPNPRWPRRYAEQPDILRYVQHVVDKYDLRRHLRLNARVAAARWQDGRWLVSLADGDTLEADVFIPAVGQLSRPSFPTIEGRDDFAGESFHSAEWRHDVDLTGKRVGVIGTGASAVQFVPKIQPLADRVSVFQRTAPYMLPRMDTQFSARHHRVFEKLPFTQKAERGAWFGLSEGLGVALLHSPALARFFTAVSRAHMKRSCADDPSLFEKAWPSYPIGCKRVLFVNDYLPALCQPNAELVTTGIERITPTGVRTVDGVDHEFDVLIWGTGFKATDFLSPMEITGRDGADLTTTWAEGARAYLGISVPDFPSLFIMYGPNTNLGSGSIIYMLESQARYIGQAVDAFGSRAMTVRREVESAYDADTQRRLSDGVWSKCDNWYRVASGRVVSNWPKLPFQYRRETSHFDAADYEPVTTP